VCPSRFDHYQRSDAGDDKARQQDSEQDVHFVPALVALQAREQYLSQLRCHKMNLKI
jgi:glycerol kinase